jgi:CheY-like chemotaxis protein
LPVHLNGNYSMPYSSILFIDDDDDDLEFFASAIHQISSSLICATENGAQKALDKLKRKETIPDVIFLDLNMPVTNGFQFLTEIKSNDNLKDIPIIVLSTSSADKTIQEAKALGAVDFITKPNNFSALKSILQNILAK